MRRTCCSQTLIFYFEIRQILKGRGIFHPVSEPEVDTLLFPSLIKIGTLINPLYSIILGVV